MPPQGFGPGPMPGQGYMGGPPPGYMPGPMPGQAPMYRPPPPNMPFYAGPPPQQGCRVGHYKLSKETIRNAKHYYSRFDVNHDGLLQRNEVAGLLMQIFRENGTPPPHPYDLNMMLVKFDLDKDGNFSKYEFKSMLKELAGHKKYNKDQYKVRKNKHKNKHKNKFKNKKHKHKHKKKKSWGSGMSWGSGSSG